MIIAWPTRSRTGSQFVLNLTSSLLGHGKLMNQARINGARKDTYHPDKKIGRFTVGDGLRYLAENGIRSMKYEDPGKDDFILEVLRAYPGAMFVCSHRPLEKVIRSHYNIKRWGHDESDVIYQFSASLALYREIAAENRLVMIDVEDAERFSAEKVARALGVEPNEDYLDRVARWRPVNDLKYQVEKSERFVAEEVQDPPRIERLRSIHPWIPDLEAEYEQLCRDTSQVDT